MTSRPTDGMVIKGLKGGILISLPALPWQRQRDLVISRIQTQERFFKGGRIALDVGETDWTEDHLLTLMSNLSDEGVCLWAVLSTSSVTLAAARSYDIPTTLRSQDAQEQAETEAPVPVWIQRDLVRGEKLNVAGDLVIVGDLAEDCEVSAGGSILVWGEVSGKLQAGTREPQKAALLLLQVKAAKLFLGEDQVEIPPRFQKRASLDIRKVGDKIRILEIKPKKGWFE